MVINRFYNQVEKFGEIISTKILLFTAKLFHLRVRKTAVTSNSDLHQLAPKVMAMLLRLRLSTDVVQSNKRIP